MQTEANGGIHMNSASRVRAVLLAAGASLALVELAAHRPGHGPLPPDDPAALVVAAAAWVAWALAAYLLAGVGVSAADHLRVRRPGNDSRLAGFTPRAVRRLVEAAVGASATAVVVSIVPAAAYADGAPPAPPPPAATIAATSPLDWPGLTTAPAPPGAPPVGLVSAAPKRLPVAHHELVVRPGDSLWSLTVRRLGPGATATQVAAEWPRLYAANRAAIGSDPDLIHPGQRLVPPAHDARTTR
jgi:hypothetical protein